MVVESNHSASTSPSINRHSISKTRKTGPPRIHKRHSDARSSCDSRIRNSRNHISSSKLHIAMRVFEECAEFHTHTQPAEPHIWATLRQRRFISSVSLCVCVRLDWTMLIFLAFTHNQTYIHILRGLFAPAEIAHSVISTQFPTRNIRTLDISTYIDCERIQYRCFWCMHLVCIYTARWTPL